MTLEELKVEAKKLGYHLVKNNPKITLLPCPICGKKSAHEWYNCLTNSYFRRCACCDDFDGYGSKTHNGARLGWNEAVENYNKLRNFDNGGQ